MKNIDKTMEKIEATRSTPPIEGAISLEVKKSIFDILHIILAEVHLTLLNG